MNAIASDRDFTETEKKFDILAEKLRNSDVVFEWHEISRKTFKFDDGDKVEYVLEIADPTVKASEGYGEIYVIARITPYKASPHYGYSPYGVTSKVVRTIYDDKTSYHLFLSYDATALYLWSELATNYTEGSLSISRVNTLIQKIIDEDRSKKVKKLIKELQYKDADYSRIEDFLDDIVDYAG